VKRRGLCPLLCDNFIVVRFVVVELKKMYTSLTESVGGSSSSSGPILIPKRFVWPYGGTRVYLIGSFTRLVLLAFLLN